jgi:hypothetical protein
MMNGMSILMRQLKHCKHIVHMKITKKRHPYSKKLKEISE